MTAAGEVQEVVLDPPPPYPTPRRSRRARRSHLPTPQPFAINQQPQLNGHQQQDSDEYLAPEPRHTRTRSDSSGSMWSTISGSPSLAQTVFTFFDDVDVDTDDDGCQGVHLARRSNAEGDSPAHDRPSTWMKVRRYFRPLRKKVYYMSLLHLLLINFPVALLAWVSLFVFTLLGTTLLIVLPIGLLLCFIDLISARLLARFELHLQTTFHFPSASLRHKPPIFTRQRAHVVDEETALLVPPTPTVTSPSPHLAPSPNAAHSSPRPTPHPSPQSSYAPFPASSHAPSQMETSFYKNTYAMFTDPTSYHALFYFLVIKPLITILFTLFVLCVVLPLMLGIVTAPAGLRLVRRMGVWQAAVAVEGLAGEA